MNDEEVIDMLTEAVPVTVSEPGVTDERDRIARLGVGDADSTSADPDADWLALGPAA